MLTPLLLGLGFGGGLWLCLNGMTRPRPALTDALESLERAGSGTTTSTTTSTTTRRPTTPVRLAMAIAQAGGLDLGVLGRDLRITNRTFHRHALEKAVAAASLFALPVVVAAALIPAGVSIPLGFVAGASLVAAAAGFVVPDLTLRSEAARRRREFRHTLAAYLDLVVIIVAGGGGTESALHDAADAGTGWAFTTIRRALAGARLGGTTPWDALRDLGGELGIPELSELAAGVSLAGEHGARVRASLVAKAKSMREEQLTEIEAEAHAATERMSLPVVLLLFGFLAFILYPALQFVLEGL